MNLHVCVTSVEKCVSQVLLQVWLRVTYRSRMDKISVGNEGEDVTNNFDRKIQQRKLAAHPHQIARGEWEVEDKTSEEVEVGGVVTNKASSPSQSGICGI